MRPWKQLAFIGAALFLFILFFPQFASTRVGKRFFLESVQTKTHTTVTARSISLSWLGPQQFSDLAFDSAECKGSIQNLRVGVHFWSMLPLFQLKNVHHINGDVSLENGSFEFESKAFPKVTLSSIQGTIRLHQGAADFLFDGTSSQSEVPGSFSMQGQLKNLSSVQPEFSVKGAFNHFPTLPIARIVSQRFDIDENVLIKILGESIDLSGAASYSDQKGLFDLTIHVPNGDAELHGNLAQDDLTLRMPLVATIRLTPELSRWIMRDFNPLFVTGIQAQDPIRLRIEPSQFHCPLASFELQHLQIGQGMIDMGQIRCRNGGSLSALISLLKSNILTSSREMNVWFSPLFFRLEKGVLKTFRVDALLADSIHICSWGNIDLSSNELDMFLGLTADTLQHSFGIKNLPEDYVLKIPLTGTTKKPNLATRAATAKIAALLASQKAPHSWITGGILNLFSQTDKDIPPPNRPFPWEK